MDSLGGSLQGNVEYSVLILLRAIATLPCLFVFSAGARLIFSVLGSLSRVFKVFSFRIIRQVANLSLFRLIPIVFVNKIIV